MTPGRRAALAIGVPVAVALVAGTGLSVLGMFAQGRQSVSYAAPGTTTSLDVNVAGGLTIAPTAGDRVTMAGTARYSFAYRAPTTHYAGGVTTIGYGCPVPTGECELDGTLGVPASVTTVTAHLGSGDITLRGTTGTANLSTGSGGVSVSGASGPLNLDADSGSIQVSGFTSRSATVTASTGSGGITVSQADAAAVYANTDAGNVSGTGITAVTVTASSGSGSIDITFTGPPPRDVRVSSNSGDIRLTFPAGATRYHVTAGSDSGAVTDGLHQDASSPYTVIATTGNGTVTLGY